LKAIEESEVKLFNETKKVTDKLKREIKKYNIVAVTYVRGSGSLHSNRKRRCLWDLCGKPMLQWPIEAALASEYVNKVVLSSEDAEILKFGETIPGVTVVPRPLHTVYEVPRDWGVGVFQRQRPRSFFSGEDLRDPEGWMGGMSSTISAIWYLFWYLQEYESYVGDIWVNVPANEPLGTTDSLNQVIEAFFLDEEANIAYTIYPIMPYIVTINPKTNQLFPLFFDYGLDRQLYPPIYRIGPFTVYGKPKKTTFNAGKKSAWTFISKEEAMDVHDEEDLFLAKCYLEKRLSKQKEVKT